MNAGEAEALFDEMLANINGSLEDTQQTASKIGTYLRSDKHVKNKYFMDMMLEDLVQLKKTPYGY